MSGGLGKKLLNPIIVFCFFAVLLLGSLAHLCYGSCQTSKWHYVIQAYHMPKYLPSSLLNAKISPENKINIYPDYTGEWKSWSEDGKLENVGMYVNGLKNGKFRSWYKNGNRQYVGEFKSGYKNGKLQLWYDNGNLEFTGHWLKNEKNGTHENWYSNGVKEFSYTYKNGVLDGKQESWWTNKKRQSIEIWENGKFQSAKDWNQDGSENE
ncbi:MAG: hypothetical protein COA79_26560 [Planctomycetota bacterium]|nr:MAG: hypothetical protein COA79_26560 [Planctomycetota bacterium]